MSPAVRDLLPLPPGLVAVAGDERSGKTSLLRALCADASLDALWLDLTLPGQDELAPAQIWQALQAGRPRWDAGLQHDLAQALGLEPHLGKTLHMLSTGTRRKVALVGLLAAGATVTCLDQPFAALDARSAGVLREVLADAALHGTRTWVVADFEADARLPWARVVRLG